MNIIVESGPENGRQFTIQGLNIVIGRGSNCDVCLQDDRLSGQHARLQYENGSWVVYDLNSSNGTWVNQRQLTGAYTLQPGDRLGVGKTVMRFEDLDMAADVAASPYPIYDGDLIYDNAPTAFATPATDSLSVWLDGGIVLAALCMMIGSPLPWISVAFLIAKETTTGTDNIDGWITLIGGALSFLLAMSTLALRTRFKHTPTFAAVSAKLHLTNLFPLLLSTGLLIVMIVSIIGVNEAVTNQEFFGISISSLVDVQVEVGLYLIGVGVIGLFLISGIHLVRGILRKA